MNFIKTTSRAVRYKKDQVGLPPRLVIVTYEDGTEITINEDKHNNLFKACCLTFGY